MDADAPRATELSVLPGLVSKLDRFMNIVKRPGLITTNLAALTLHYLTPALGPLQRAQENRHDRLAQYIVRAWKSYTKCCHDEWLEFIRIKCQILADQMAGLRLDYNGRPADHYNITTTYSQIVEFATRINCLVALGISKHGHHPGNIRRWYCIQCHLPPHQRRPLHPCNTRMVVLALKKLDAGTVLNPGTYPNGTESRWRWCPDVERNELNEQEWRYRWFKADGTVGFIWSRNQMPKAMVWHKLEVKKEIRGMVWVRKMF
ncbi:hypothetical protein K458DRAFT_388767 [Lentithecium fluviatile CBS 122367]|uniref:Uncharacterized protein n=1 Tax=Lentithecium fluviatile CBS 122367 TaxID=1168545 RepID=A0A6G1J269_9PLEO|nr:hypothetical protein K458DRAFT_388767 [Lentithecium fluviatile CBS 122367]